MGKNNFILYTIAYIGIAVLLIFKIGPNILNGGRAINIIPEKFIKTKGMYLEYHSGLHPLLSKRYLNVKIKTEKEPIELQFFTPDEKYKPLLNILEENKLIENNEKFLTSLPISFNERELNFINNLDVIYSKEKLIYIAINNKVIGGDIPYIRKGITIFIGYFVIIIGGLGLVLLPMGAYFQIKENEEHGTKIYVPNRLEGIKNFFRVFMKK